MINLLIEILLLLPFGMFIIKAVQALTDEGGLLRGLVSWLNQEIIICSDRVKNISNRMYEVQAESEEGVFDKKYKALESIEDKAKFRLNTFLFFTKPLYRCPVCMSSIWGTLNWLWWVRFSPLPIGTWPIFCLVLCGAMYMYENRYAQEVNIFTKDSDNIEIE